MEYSTLVQVSTVMCGDVESWVGENEEAFCSIISSKKDTIEGDMEMMYQKLSMLQLRLDEATKTLQIEREYVFYLFVKGVSLGSFQSLEFLNCLILVSN